MASLGLKQPPWTPPTRSPNAQLPPLKIFNSLTRSKNDFIPADPEGKKVSYYTCGPTVYDDAHLGHARNYIATDYLRRILRDYFGYQVKFVLNVTDIDDKIILRARQRYLLAQFKEKHGAETATPVAAEAIQTTSDAFKHYIQRNLPLLGSDITPVNLTAKLQKAYPTIFDESLPKGDLMGEKEAKLKMHVKTATLAASALQEAPTTQLEFYKKADDVLLPYLDSLYSSSIDSNNHEIFARLAKNFENRFFEDMRSLNVMMPDVITRVSEYVPQVVEFVEKVVANGFAYATPDGSVYFDINAFEQAGHFYARLEPWSRNNKDLQADGEGALSKNTSVKQSDSDFALWKASKPGEPAWPSPWGPGRPGWHVECSVMASDVLGKVIDLHGGGEDLKFPHHDNELAQSTAYWSSRDESVPWVNYFIHTGHLGIQGLKMSKSLKNFTTIRSSLESDWTARRLRIAFLLGAWQDTIDLSDDLLETASGWENRLDNFFLKAIDVTRNPTQTATNGNDQEMLDVFEQVKTDVHEALCDSFNTPDAMRSLASLVTKVNGAEVLPDDILISIARWVTRMVTIFGLDADGNLHDNERIGWSGVLIPESAVPFVYPLSHIRDSIRRQALSTFNHDDLALVADKAYAETKQPRDSPESSSRPYKEEFDKFYGEIKSLVDSKASAKEFLTLCDQLRDMRLPEQGIYLEDRPDLPALVRPLNRSLATALEQRKAASTAKSLEAKARREAEEQKKKQQAEKAKLSHLEMFKSSQYSEWDEQGIPTKDNKGEEVTKSQKKKLVKEWERQKKLHEAYLQNNKTEG